MIQMFFPEFISFVLGVACPAIFLKNVSAQVTVDLSEIYEKVSTCEDAAYHILSSFSCPLPGLILSVPANL